MPNGWSKQKISDILERIVIPVAPVEGHYYREIGIRSHGKGVFHKEKVTSADIGNKRVFEVIENAFVVNIVFAWEQAIAKTTSKELGFIASHRFPQFLPKNGRCEIDYLVYFFKTPKGKYLLGLASPGGAGRNKTLGQKEFERLELNLPPTQEQRKIVKILSTWDKAIATTEKLIETSKQQKEALMQQILTGKKRLVNPDTGKVFEGNWEEVKLENIASKVMVGIASAATHAYSTSGVRMLRNLNIKNGWIDDSDILFVSEEYEYQHRNKRLIAGDILTVRTGYPGLSAVVPETFNNAQCFTSLITRLNQEMALPDFVCKYINSEFGKKFISSGEAGGAQKNVNAGILKKMPIPLPSLSEQHRISTVLTVTDKEIKVLEAKLAHFKQEKKALMQQLLTGKRRVKIDEVEVA